MKKFATAALLTTFVTTIGVSVSWWYYADLLELRGKAARQYERWAGDKLDRHLRSLARLWAVNCGTVHVHDDPEAASDCAVKAFASRKSFLVRYDLEGIDSAVAVGFAASPSEVYVVKYDSMGWSDEGLRPTARISDDRHLITDVCPKPIKLLKTKIGRLSCSPPDPDAKPSIMSPSAEPY